jgi:putative transposase
VLGILNINRSTYYRRDCAGEKNRNISKGRTSPGYSYRADGTIVSDIKIQSIIKTIKADKTGRFYGYKKVTAALNRQHSIIINKKKVYRLMMALNLLKEKSKPVRRYSRICRNHTINDSNQFWEMDIKYAYIAGERKVAYIVSIIDVFDRVIVGSSLSLSCTAQEAKKALINALYKRKIKDRCEGLIIRSDNGPQFISFEFEKCCIEEKVFHERIPVKSPNYNAHIESYHRYLQDECLKGKMFGTLEELNYEHSDFETRYNTERIHSSIGYRTPEEFYYEKESNFKKNYSLNV